MLSSSASKPVTLAARTTAAATAHTDFWESHTASGLNQTAAAAVRQAIPRILFPARRLRIAYAPQVAAALTSKPLRT